MSDSTIITGQYVHISQTAASLGERFVARFIDYVLLFIYMWALNVFFIEALLTKGSVLSYIFYIIFYLPAFLYDPLCETFNNGQSLGKRIMGIRVVMLDGSTPSVSAYLLRWLLFFVNILMVGGVDCFSILITKHKQRIGDLAAGTMVIRLNNYRRVKVSLDEYSHLNENYRPVYKQAVDLSFDQAKVIEKVLSIYDRRRSQYVKDLAMKVKDTLEVEPVEKTYEAFLVTVLHDFQFYAYIDV